MFSHFNEPSVEPEPPPNRRTTLWNIEKLISDFGIIIRFLLSMKFLLDVDLCRDKTGWEMRCRKYLSSVWGHNLPFPARTFIMCLRWEGKMIWHFWRRKSYKELLKIRVNENEKIQLKKILRIIIIKLSPIVFVLSAPPLLDWAHLTPSLTLTWLMVVL